MSLKGAIFRLHRSVGPVADYATVGLLLWAGMTWATSHLSFVFQYGWGGAVVAGYLLVCFLMLVTGVLGVGFWALAAGWRMLHPLNQERSEQRDIASRLTPTFEPVLGLASHIASSELLRELVRSAPPVPDLDSESLSIGGIREQSRTLKKFLARSADLVEKTDYRFNFRAIEGKAESSAQTQLSMLHRIGVLQKFDLAEVREYLVSRERALAIIGMAADKLAEYPAEIGDQLSALRQLALMNRASNSI
jgi:hypothetical protein